jgi:hypothetical protein
MYAMQEIRTLYISFFKLHPPAIRCKPAKPMNAFLLHSKFCVGFAGLYTAIRRIVRASSAIGLCANVSPQ